MAKAGRSPITTREHAQQFVRLCRDDGAPVSMTRGVAEVRQRSPQCSLSDRELVKLLARTAVEAHCDVIFDHPRS